MRNPKGAWECPDAFSHGEQKVAYSTISRPTISLSICPRRTFADESRPPTVFVDELDTFADQDAFDQREGFRITHISTDLNIRNGVAM